MLCFVKQGLIPAHYIPHTSPGYPLYTNIFKESSHRRPTPNQSRPVRRHHQTQNHRSRSRASHRQTPERNDTQNVAEGPGDEMQHDGGGGSGF